MAAVGLSTSAAVFKGVGYRPFGEFGISLIQAAGLFQVWLRPWPGTVLHQAQIRSREAKSQFNAASRGRPGPANRPSAPPPGTTRAPPSTSPTLPHPHPTTAVGLAGAGVVGGTGLASAVLMGKLGLVDTPMKR